MSTIKSKVHLTDRVNRWYRPPELLWGSRHYSSAVDIWSVGTIFVELVLRVPFLSGETDIDQLKKMFQAMGTPTEQEWPVSFFLSLLSPNSFLPTLSLFCPVILASSSSSPLFRTSQGWQCESQEGRAENYVYRDIRNYQIITRWNIDRSRIGGTILQLSGRKVKNSSSC